MKRSIKVKWGKLQVGILIMFAITLLLWTSFTGGGTSIFESKKKFVCYFANVNGLITGSPVWMSGLEVGNVSDIKFVFEDSLRQIRVVCKVQAGVWERVTRNARVQLGTIGFLGDKYVELIPGVNGEPPIEEMGVVATEDVGNAPAMMKAGEDAFKEAGSLMGNLDTLLMRMNRGEGTLGKLARDEALYVQLTALLADLTQLSAALQHNQERLTKSIERMSGSLASISDKVNENTGTIGRLVNDPALYDNLTATSARMDSILTKVDGAQGNVGLLVNDTALYVELTNLLARANNLITDIESDPRKYFKFSVF
ncbi:MAG: MCE family protein [candidate division Zixibacteria bacterium]|nr:MCE family protein [candidate division Zixibacteria bacterium]